MRHNWFFYTVSNNCQRSDPYHYHGEFPTRVDVKHNRKAQGLIIYRKAILFRYLSLRSAGKRIRHITRSYGTARPEQSSSDYQSIQLDQVHLWRHCGTDRAVHPNKPILAKKHLRCLRNDRNRRDQSFEFLKNREQDPLDNWSTALP